MQATGIVGRVDDLGRIVIPRDIRRGLNIKEGEALEIYTSVESGVAEIIFRKYQALEDCFEEKCAEYVHKKKDIITGAFYTEDRTTVMLSSGETKTVRRHPADHFNMNVAICYALAKMGYKEGNPAADR